MKRNFVSRYYELVIDGDEPAGFVASVDWPEQKGELLAQPTGAHPYKVKHIHNPTIGPITVRVGITMSSGFFKWIADSWAGRVSRKNGAIITYDANMKVVHELSFEDALILEMTVPTLDASSKDPFYFTIKFQPERVEHKMQSSRSKPTILPQKQKIILPSNFVVDIQGLGTKSVSKVEQFVVKQNVKPLTAGPYWSYQNEPTSLEYPNLTITFGMTDAATWFDWHREFVAHGVNDMAKEKTGSITVMSTDLKTEIFEVELHALGLVNLTPERTDTTAQQDTIRRIKAELYCEEMTFKFLSA